MEYNIMSKIIYFSQDGLIFFYKSNEYYKSNPLKFEDIICIYNSIDTNSKFQNL